MLFKVKENQAAEQYKQIQKFIQGTVAEGSPIIPISAQLKFNIDVICEYLVKTVPSEHRDPLYSTHTQTTAVPTRNFTASPRLIVIRSFDVNKPGAEVEELKGGVAGGSILQGVLKVSLPFVFYSLVRKGRIDC